MAERDPLARPGNTTAAGSDTGRDPAHLFLMRRDDSVFLISYIVVHNTPNTTNPFSPFQGYGMGILSSAAAFLRIASLGFDLRDAPDALERRLWSRMTGVGARVIPLQLSSLEEGLRLVPGPFICVCSAPGIEASVAEIIDSSGRPIWHVPARSATAFSATGDRTEEGNDGDQFIEGAEWDEAFSAMTRSGLRDYTLSTLDELSGEIPSDYSGLIRDTLARHQLTCDASISDVTARSTNKYGHLVTLPNEYVLEALGFHLRSVNPPTLPSSVSLPYEEAILDGATTILGVRVAALANDEGLRKSPDLRNLVPYDIMVVAPAMGRHWYSGALRRKLGNTDRKLKKALRAMMRAFAEQAGYQPTMEMQALQLATASPIGQVFLRIRRLELQALTAVVALRAAADAVPVIRTPMEVNTVHERAERVCTAARQVGANRLERLNRFAREMSDHLTDALPPSFLALMEEAGPGIKIVADAPLEWARIRDVPLLLRKTVSRIPATPGNLNVLATLPVEEELIPLSALSQVLVLRSFTPHDPIRNDLMNAVDRVKQMASKDSEHLVELRFADVNTEDDIVAALQSFDGALLIFDCHGAHNRGDEYGSLRIGGRDLDPRQLRGRARIPPAVVTSACDTHPLDGSHASVAAALLGSGARTVLGTTMPVTSKYAALFVARLVLRLHEWLPVALGRPPHMARWSSLVSGLQRRVHMTELLEAVDGKSDIRLSPAARHSIAVQVGMKIEEGADDWYEDLLSHMSSESNANLQSIRDAVAKWATITDALKYVQLGNPESLVVVSDRTPRTSAS